jgi:serine/threonine protein kinase
MTERGEVLAGRFKLIEPMGEGGMATVWRAEHVELGSALAIKLIAKSVADSERGLARFKREAKAAAALTSAHVVQIFDYGVHDGEPYIAMELLEGESLAQRLARQGSISPPLTARVLTHIARAIHKAHQAGILHRDLKPDHVFISLDDEDQEHIKVLDFGVAKVLDSGAIANIPSHTSTGSLVGSPFYMGPEKIRGHKTLDHRGDLWSLGVIAYECLTGRRPFQGGSLGDLVMAVCSDPLPVPTEQGCLLGGFDDWFAKACARKPDHRFQSAKELAKQFRALLGADIEQEDSQDSLTGPSAPPHSPLATSVATTPGLARTHDPPPDAVSPSARLAKIAVAGMAVAAVVVASIVLFLPPTAQTEPAGARTTPAADDAPSAVAAAEAGIRDSTNPLDSGTPTGGQRDAAAD